MRILLFIFICLLLIKLYRSRETFYGMNYIQKHTYLKCCNSLGCGHPRCQNFLHYNKSPLHLIGIIYEKGTSNGNIHKLYRRINKNSYREEYFIKIYNTNDDFIYKKIKVNYLYNGDEITLNNRIYIVSLYENNGLPLHTFNFNNKNYNNIYNNLYNYVVPNFNRFYTNNMYSGQTNRKYYNSDSIPYNYLKHGYIYDKDSDNYMLIYKNNTGRNRWKYYVKKSDVLIPLDNYENRDIYENDKIKIPFNNKDYDFKEFDN